MMVMMPVSRSSLLPLTFSGFDSTSAPSDEVQCALGEATGDSAVVLLSVRCRLSLGHEAGAVLRLDGLAFVWQPGQLDVFKVLPTGTLDRDDDALNELDDRRDPSPVIVPLG
jgi:hypothetical protein